MFERLLDHPNIEVREEVDFDHLVYTGPIDAFYE